MEDLATIDSQARQKLRCLTTVATVVVADAACGGIDHADGAAQTSDESDRYLQQKRWARVPRRSPRMCCFDIGGSVGEV